MKTQKEQKGQKNKNERKTANGQQPNNELFLVKSVCIGASNVNPGYSWLRKAVRQTKRQMGVG